MFSKQKFGYGYYCFIWKLVLFGTASCRSEEDLSRTDAMVGLPGTLEQATDWRGEGSWSALLPLFIALLPLYNFTVPPPFQSCLSGVSSSIIVWPRSSFRSHFFVLFAIFIIWYYICFSHVPIDETCARTMAFKSCFIHWTHCRVYWISWQCIRKQIRYPALFL